MLFKKGDELVHVKVQIRDILYGDLAVELQAVNQVKNLFFCHGNLLVTSIYFTPTPPKKQHEKRI